VFTVSKTNGDITSMKYRGTETNGYQGKNSHVESGLGTSVVTIKQYTSMNIPLFIITLLIFPAPANIIQVTVTYGTLVQTYIARYGNNNIYMLTNKGDASVSPPLLSPYCFLTHS